MGILKKTPRTAKEWADEGMRLGGKRKHPQALECFNKGMELCGNDNELRGTIWIHKGSSHFALGEHQEALRCYEKAMEVDPVNEPICWELKGHVLYYWDKSKYYQEAKMCLAKASRMEKVVYGKADAPHSVLSYRGVDVAVDSRHLRHEAMLEIAMNRFQKLDRLRLASM